MFEDLLRDIQATFADRFLKVQVNVNAPPPPPATRAMPPAAPAEPSTDDLFRGGAPSRLPLPAVAATGPSGAALGAMAQPEVGTAVGRNDPCPCGSGRKYKKCHGASA